MKFGDTLWQRSVPQWRSHNIDYTAIKGVIKEHTTPGKGKGVAVPGNSERIAKDFEENLFTLFVQEHDRVSLFVKSKRYEINGRLDSIERQLNHIQSRMPADDVPRNTARLRQRYSRIESEILSVGEEIQNLSRFVTINTLAIRKLLKKYRKWTGSTYLSPRVQEQVLNQPESFSQCKLKPALNQYTVFLDMIRSPFEKKTGSVRPVSTSFYNANYQRDEVGRIISLFQGSAVDFDVGLEMPSVDQNTQRASYWVHKDNIVELRVLLLQHMRYAKASSENAQALAKDADDQSNIETEDFVETIIVDDPARFVSAHNEPLIVKRPMHPEDGSKAAFKALWTSDEEASVLLRNSPDEAGAIPDIKKLKKRELATTLNSKSGIRHVRHGSSSDDDYQNSPLRKASEGAVAVRFWLGNNADAKQLVHLKHRRSRFVGLNNSVDRGFWATIDDDIVMKSCLKEIEYGNQSESESSSSKQAFPHAVLTLRGERSGVGLLKILDQTHLTERVQGFSKEAHAVSACCDLPNMPTPYWFSILENDIRHIPEDADADSRKSSLSTALSRSSASAYQPLTSRSGPTETPPTTNSDEQITNAPSLTNVRLKDNKRVSKPKRQRQTPQQRYWSEYDQPESEVGGDGETFYIYVDPEAPFFPGQNTLNRLSKKLQGLFSRERKSKAADIERDGALATNETIDQELASPSTSDDSDEDALGEDNARRLLGSNRGRRSQQTYGTLRLPAAAHNLLPRLRDNASVSKFWWQPYLTPFCLGAAVVILVTVCALYGASDPSLQTQLNAALIFGIVASLIFATVGTVSYFVKQRSHKRSYYFDSGEGV